MYAGKHAKLRPLQPAFIMAGSGETVTYRELDARSNRLAHLFRERGLKRLDHYAIFMENNSRYLEACGAGERSGLYFTCVNSYLTPGELAYILTNSESRILITSLAKLDVAREALKRCPRFSGGRFVPKTHHPRHEAAQGSIRSSPQPGRCRL